MEAAELRLILSATDQASKVVKGFGAEAERSLASVGRKMRDVGGIMTAGVTLPIAAGAAVAVKAASDLGESMNKANVVFGKSAKAVQEWSQTTSGSMGQSRQQALEATATFGNLFKTMGIGQKDAAGMSMNLTSLASDLASFNNIDPTQALDALRSGLVGEAEPMRALGVLLSETAVKAEAYRMGLAKSGTELTEQQKVAARYSLILQQTKTAQGDFARTSDGVANSSRILRAQLTDVAGQLGTVLLPYVQKVAASLVTLLQRFDGLSPGAKRIIVIVGLVVAAIGPLLMVLGQIIAIAPAVGAAFTFMTGPVGLIIAAIAAVVAIFVVLWTKCDWFRNFWLGLWDILKTAAKAFWDWAGPTITAAAEAIWSALKVAFDKVKAVFEFVWPYVKKVVEVNIAAIKLIVQGISVIVDWVRDHWDTIKKVTDTAWGLIKGFVLTNVNGIKTIVKGISAIVGFVRDAFNGAKDVVETVGGKLKSAAEGIWNAITKTARTAWDGITGVVRDAWNNIAGFINKIIGGINWVLDKVPGLGGQARIPLLPTGGGGRSIQQLAEDVGGQGRGLSPSVSTPAIMDNGGMGGPEAQGADAGKGGGLLSGIGSALSGAAGWVTDLWDKFGIGAQLPKPIGGLFGGASNALLEMAKEAIVGLLKKFADRGDRNSIIEFAKSMLGVPYVWGGTSPAGFDCSGLIYWAYQQAGIKDFPRIPTYGGKQISYSQIQPADVLFYYPNAVQDGRTVPFGHFKMYAGGGQTIESTSGGVQMRPVQDGYAQIRSYLALGGITKGLALVGEGGAAHPEAVVPLTNPRRGAAVLKAAGLLPGMGRGGDVVQVNVDARGSADPAAVRKAAREGALQGFMAYAEAKRKNRGAA